VIFVDIVGESFQETIAGALTLRKLRHAAMLYSFPK